MRMPSSSTRSKQLFLDELPSNHANPALRRPLAQCSAAGALSRAGLRIDDLTGVIYEPLRDRFALSRDPAFNYMLCATRS
jgi:2-polyprenyl-3-methyl-5-hydroxy-6-metoxy-1,4-benzoquinol methylase